MARPKCLMRDFTKILKLFRVHCTENIQEWKHPGSCTFAEPEQLSLTGFPRVTSNEISWHFSWQSSNLYWLFAAWKYDILTFAGIHMGHTGAKQDWRWNTEKPSATLDPWIPTWLSTSPTNHRPANFWKFQKPIFFKHFMKRNWKVVQSISGWIDIDNPYRLSWTSYIYIYAEFWA